VFAFLLCEIFLLSESRSLTDTLLLNNLLVTTTTTTTAAAGTRWSCYQNNLACSENTQQELKVCLPQLVQIS
jgi:hypothetical protein